MLSVFIRAKAVHAGLGILLLTSFSEAASRNRRLEKWESCRYLLAEVEASVLLHVLCCDIPRDSHLGLGAH